MGFINPADPTHQDFQFNTNAAQFQPHQQRQPETFNPTEFSSSIPACAGCQDLNTFINPADPSHAALFQQQQSFRQPAQPAQRAFQPQQPQQQQQQFFRLPAQQQQQPQPAILQQPQRQQQFQPQQQFQQPQQQF